MAGSRKSIKLAASAGNPVLAAAAAAAAAPAHPPVLWSSRRKPGKFHRTLSHRQLITHLRLVLGKLPCRCRSACRQGRSPATGPTIQRALAPSRCPRTVNYILMEDVYGTDLFGLSAGRERRISGEISKNAIGTVIDVTRCCWPRRRFRFRRLDPRYLLARRCDRGTLREARREERDCGTSDACPTHANSTKFSRAARLKGESRSRSGQFVNTSG